MDRYTRWFVLASLAYLAIGGGLGFMMIVSPGLAPLIYFSHVHVLLAGFMAMMIFGVGYFILPRFAARALIWPAAVGIHFWIANLSLVVFLIAKPMALGGSSAWTGLTHTAALVQVLSIMLFVFNLGGTLWLSGKPAGPVAVPAAQSAPSLAVVGTPEAAVVRFSATTPVAEVCDKKEGALELLIEAGLSPLADPQHLEMVRARGIPLGHACSRHGIPFEELLERLHALPTRAAPVELSADTVIGELVRRHPGAREVLQRRFGEGCFTCPGFETETLQQGAMMHGVDVETLLAEMREACSS